MSVYSNDARIELTGQSIELEQRLIPVTRELNSYPLVVSRAAWQKAYDQAERVVAGLVEYSRYLTCDDHFRPNSRADCKRALYGSVEADQPTDKDALTVLMNGGSMLAETIIEARSAISHLSQLRKWSALVELGSVQPIWNSTGTPHGRYTSASPCLMNRIKPIRATILPAPGFTFLGTDLSQAEYVCWASLSGDLNLSQLFLEGKDFHSEQIRMVQELVPTLDLRGQDPRQSGKTLNFSILYRMKPYTLSAKLGCSLAIARQIVKVYHRRAKMGVKYMHRTLATARELGFIDTHFGRRRYCWEYQADSCSRDIHEVEKTLWNHHIAGTTAELVKFKQVETWEELRRLGLTADHARLSIQAYDGLVWSCRDDVFNDAEAIIREVWARRVSGFLPFRSKITSGRKWSDL